MMKSADQINVVFSKAVSYLQQAKFENAKRQFIKISKARPDSAVVWYNLGLCFQNLGQHSKAVDAYKKALKINPGSTDAWVNMGISHDQLQQKSLAEKAVQKALQCQPQHARARNLLGSLLAEEGKYETAKKQFEACLNVDSNNKDAKINLANLQLDFEQHQLAEPLLTELFQQYPEDKTILLLRAKFLLADKNTEAAASIVFALEKQYPNDDDVQRLGISFREVIKDHFGAIDLIEKQIKKCPNEARLWNSLGMAYFQLDSIKKSKYYFEKAIKYDNNHAEYQNNLGLAYSSLGDRAHAEKFYRKSLELDPRHSETYGNIATMKRFKSIEDRDAQSIIKLWQQNDLNEIQTIKTAFALGKVYDDCGLYDAAFSVYQKGNNLKFKESSADLDRYFLHIERVAKHFKSAPTYYNNNTSPAPIFVLGMPRSGTTLVEQIITRHSAVTGCGELPCIEKAIARLEKKSRPMRVYPDDFLSIDNPTLANEAQFYLDWVAQLHDIQSAFFTDKMPFNFVHIWLIKALFPDSAIIHCQRHPLDVITSNYFQLYGSDVSFVYNLNTLTQYYILYHRLMSHWHEVFKNDIYSAVYEDLITDQEQQTRALIKNINLPWEDNCLVQKSSGTAVRTASIWQVREGIYTRSKERWRHYADFLKQPIALLAAQGITDDAGNWLVTSTN